MKFSNWLKEKDFTRLIKTYEDHLGKKGVFTVQDYSKGKVKVYAEKKYLEKTFGEDIPIKKDSNGWYAIAEY